LYVLDSKMSMRKKITNKEPVIEASSNRSRQDKDPYSLGLVHNETTKVLKKGGDSLKWDEVFYMFKIKTFPVEAEDQDEIQIFKNIQR